MFGRSSRNGRLVVVVATRHPGALAALESIGDVERREALTTGGLYRALRGAQLVVADLESLAETEPNREQIRHLLAGVLAVDGATFAANPDEWLARARAMSGIGLESLPPRTVVFSSLSGGVGKTTLSLSLARYFRARGLSVAVAELCLGPSALLALAGNGGHHLYEVATQGKQWPSWNGITLAPMDWRTAQLMDLADIKKVWQSLADTHILTIFDAPAYHPLWSVVVGMGHLLILSDGRPDSLANALYLWSEVGSGDIVLNRSGLTARLALDIPPAAVLPDVGSDARSFPPGLARRLAPVIYPGWRL